MAETWFAAAKKADYGAIRSLGSKYFKVHNESDDGNTALLYAISSSNMQLISYLAPHEVRETNIFGWTALMFAAYFDNHDAVKLFLNDEKGMQTREEYKGIPAGATALLIAATRGHTGCVSLLYPMEQSTSGWNDLFLAAFTHNAALVARTISLVSTRDALGRTAMMYLVMFPRHSTLVLLEECIGYLAQAQQGAIDACTKTALMYAAENNNADAVQLLLQLTTLEARKQMETKDEYTALMIAASRGYSDIVLQLLPKEAGIVTSNGVTALMLAVRYNQIEAARLLKDAEAEFQTSGPFDVFSPAATAFSIAQYYHRQELLSLLGAGSLQLTNTEENITTEDSARLVQSPKGVTASSALAFQQKSYMQSPATEDARVATMISPIFNSNIDISRPTPTNHSKEEPQDNDQLVLTDTQTVAILSNTEALERLKETNQDLATRVFTMQRSMQLESIEQQNTIDKLDIELSLTRQRQTELESKLKLAEEKITMYKDYSQQAYKHNESLSKKYAELKESHDSLVKENAQLSDSLASLKSEKASLETVHKDLAVLFDELQRQIKADKSAADSHITKYSNEVLALQQDLSETKQALAAAQAAAHSKDQVASSVTEELSQLKPRYQDLTREISDLRAKYEEAVTHSNTIQQENNLLKDNFDKATSSLTSLKEENICMQKRLAEAETINAELHTTVTDLNKAKISQTLECEKLSEQTAGMEDQVQGLQHSLHKATSEVESLNSRLAEQTLESQNLRASIDQLQKDLVSLANEKDILQTQLCADQERLAITRSELSAARQKALALEETLDVRSSDHKILEANFQRVQSQVVEQIELTQKAESAKAALEIKLSLIEQQLLETQRGANTGQHDLAALRSELQIAAKKNECLETRTAELETAADNLSKEKATLVAKLQDITEERESLKEQLNAFSFQLEQLQSDKSALEHQVSDLLDVISQEQETQVSLKKQIVEAGRRSAELDEEVLRLKDKLDKAIDEASTLTSKLASSEEDNAKTEAKFANLSKERNSLFKELSTVSKELSDLKLANASLEKDAQLAQQKLKEANVSKKSLEQSSSNSSKKIASLSSAKTSLEKQLSTANAHISDLESQLTALEKRDSEAKQVLLAKEKNITEANRSVSQLKRQLKDIRADNETAQNNVIALTKELTSLQLLKDQTDATVVKLTKAVADEREKNESLSKQLNEANRQISTLQSAQDSIELARLSATDRVEALLSENKGLGELITDLKTIISRTQNMLQEMTDEKNNALERLKQADSKIATYALDQQTTKASVDQLRADLSTMEGANRQLQKDIVIQTELCEDLERKNNQLSKQISELIKCQAALEEQLQSKDAAFTEEQSARDALQRELSLADKRYQNLQEEHMELKQALANKRIDIEQMSNSKLSADTALQKAMEKCSALQAEVTLGQKSIESMAQHIRVLENEIDRLKEKNASIFGSLSQAEASSESLERELKAAKRKIAELEEHGLEVEQEQERIFKGLQTVTGEKDVIERRLKEKTQLAEEQHAELEALKKALAASNELNTDLTSNSESSVKSIQQLSRQLAESQGEIAGLKRGAELTARRLSELEALCDDQAKVISAKTSTTTELQTERDLLFKKLAACTAASTEIEDTLATMQKEYSDQSRKLMELEADNLTLQRTVSSSEKAIEDLNVALMAANQAADKSGRKILDLEGRREILERSLAHVNKRNTSLEAEKEQLAKNLIEANRCMTDAELERNTLTRENASLRAAAAELEGKLSTSATALAGKTAAVLDLENQVELLTHERSDLMALKLELEAERDSLQVRVKMHAETIVEMEKSKADTEQLLVTTNTKLVEQEMAFQTAERTLKTLKEKVRLTKQEKTAALSIQADLKSEIATLSETIKTLEDTVNSLTKQISERDRDNESLRTVANGHRSNEEKALEEVERQRNIILDYQQQVSQASLEQLALAQKIDQEKKKVVDAMASKEGLQDDLQALQKRYSELETEYDAIKKALASNNATMEKLTLQCSSLTAELSTLKLQYNSTRVELESAQMLVEATKKGSASLQGEIDKLTRDLQQANEANSQLRAEQNVLQQSLDNANASLNALVTQGETLSRATADSNKKLHDYMSELTLKNNEVDSLKRLLARKEADLEEVHTRITSKIEEISQLYSDKEQAEAQICVLLSENSDLKMSISALTSTLDSQKQLVKDLEGELISAHGELKNTSSEVGRLELELQNLRGDNKDSHNRIETLNQQMISYDKQMASIAEEKEGLLKLVSQLKLTINELTLAKQELGASLATEKMASLKLASENDDLLKRLESGRAAYEELSAEHKSLLERYHTLNSMKELANTELNALRSTANMSKADIDKFSAEYERFRANASQDRAVIVKLQSDLEKLESKNKFLLDEKTQCTKIIKNLNKDIVDLKLQLHSLDQSKESATRKLSVLGTDKEALIKEVDSLRKQTCDQEHLIHELQKQSKETERLKEDLAHMNTTMGEFADMYAVTINKYADAMRHHDDISKFMPKYNTYMSDAGLMTDARLRHFLENNKALLDEKALVERKFKRLSEYVNYIKAELVNTDMKYLAWIQHKTAVFNRSVANARPTSRPDFMTKRIDEQARRLSTALEPTDFSASDEMNIERASIDRASLAKQLQACDIKYDATRTAQYDHYPSRPSSQNN